MTKKILVCFLFIILLSGCGAKKSLIVDTENYSSGGLVAIDSVCDQSCNDLIREKIPENSENYEIGHALVLSINDKFGDGTFYDNRGSFNSTWDGSFVIQTNSGKKKALLKPNYWKAHPMMERDIEFSTEAGSNYFLGHLLVTAKGGYNYSYAWTPIVVNKTNNKLVFPVEKPKWQGENVQGSAPIYIPILK